MTLTVDTDHKTILFSGCDMSEAVHFARLHEFDGYTVKKDLPAYRVDYAGTFKNPEPFNPDEIFRGILAKENPEYLDSEVVQVQHTNTLRFPNGVECQIAFCDENKVPKFLQSDDKVIIASGQMEVKRVKK